jgi:hypothetical protein
MTAKADFNAEEWSEILAGPPAAALRVVMAQRGGTIRESLAVGKAYSEARGQHGENELLDAIVSDRPELQPKDIQAEGDVPGALIRKLTAALDILQGKATPDEIQAYKQFVVDVAYRVASAKKEGGVLGIGGKPIGDKEQVALDEITSILGISGPTPTAS